MTVLVNPPTWDGGNTTSPETDEKNRDQGVHIPSESQDDKIKKQLAHLEGLCPEEGYKKLIDLNVLLYGETRRLAQQCLHLKEELKKQEMEIKKCAHIKTNGEYRWRIDNFTSKFGLHRVSDEDSIVSDHFQDPDGHEFRLRLFMNGTGRGKNLYMSLFIQVCSTKFDASLDWPIQGVIKFRLIDQQKTHSGKKHLESMFKTNGSSCFQEPDSPFNPENGLVRFVPHDTLFSGEQKSIFIRNDTIFIDVKFEFHRNPETPPQPQY